MYCRQRGNERSNDDGFPSAARCMQDLQTTVRMESLALERRALPPVPTRWWMFLSPSSLPGYHHAGREGVGPSASRSSNAGLYPLCELSSLGTPPAEEAGPGGADPCANISAVSKGVDRDRGVGRGAWPWGKSPLLHGLMAKGQHRERAPLESWWRQALPSTPGARNTRLSPQ